MGLKRLGCSFLMSDTFWCFGEFMRWRVGRLAHCEWCFHSAMTTFEKPTGAQWRVNAAQRLRRYFILDGVQPGDLLLLECPWHATLII